MNPIMTIATGMIIGLVILLTSDIIQFKNNKRKKTMED